MHKKKQNRFDAVFDTMLSTDKGIKDLVTLGDSEQGTAWLTFLLTKYMDLQALKAMYQTKLLPALREAQVMNIKEAKTSKYREHIHFAPEPTEDIEEWVRYGYVMLFHKYESFHRGVIQRAADLYAGCFSNDETINAFVQRTFGVNLEDEWRIDETVWEANYITNSMKHKDGYPKQPKRGDIDIPRRFRGIDPNVKLSIKPQDFYRDIQLVEEWEKGFVQMVLGIQALRIGLETLPTMTDTTSLSRVQFIQKVALMKAAIAQLLAPLHSRLRLEVTV